MSLNEDAIVIETGKNPTHCIIWLHGLGADGHDFEPVVPELSLPDDLPVRFVFPHAPVQPVTINGGASMRAWYDITEISIDRKIDLEGLRASSQRVSTLIDTQTEAGIPARNIVIAGFSQGGAVAYDAALRYPTALAGLMAFSTYYATAGQFTPAPAQSRLPILIQHGTQDPVIPQTLGRQAADTLRSDGYAVTYQTYAMTHGLCMEQIQAIRTWLTGHLTGQA